MMASSLHWLTMAGIGWGVFVLLAVILSRVRGRMVGISVLFLMMMAMAGTALFMFMPAGRVARRARLVPPIPRLTGVELPPVAVDTGSVNLDLYIDNVKEHGQRAAESARIKIQAGAEAISGVAQQFAEQTQVLMLQHPIPPIHDVAHGVVDGVRRARPISLAATGLMAFAIGALLYLGYIFLDAGTRGHFTWSLRFVSVVTFAALCLAISVLRHGR